ncbi:hypothetical protein, partial [Neisseria gonorrhoeae]|uniref:hypothetical protein n=7 Tax=Neisseria gonorrhoeae TaxID=485 RepID=UPI00352FF15B
MRFGFSFRYAPTAKTVKNRKTPKVVTDSLPFVTAFVTNFLSFSYFYSELNLNRYGVASPCRTICTVCGSPPCPDLNLIHYTINIFKSLLALLVLSMPSGAMSHF